MAEEKKIETPAKKTHYIVDKEKSFRDINDFNKVYHAGADVSHFDKKRIDNLIEIGLVVKTEK